MRMIRQWRSMAGTSVALFLLMSCSLRVKVREEWDPSSRGPIPLGEVTRTWVDLKQGRAPSAADLAAYNTAVRNSVAQIADRWASNEGHVTLIKTTNGEVRLRLNSINLSDLDLAEEMVPADFVKVRRGLRSESVVAGVGASLIIRQPKTESDPMIPETGIWTPVTALLNLDRPDAPVLDLIDTGSRGTISFAGTEFPLAANYTAAFARDFQDRQFQFKSVGALLRFEEYADRIGLYRVTPFHPDKEPIIFIHGINSSPSTWNEVLNRLYGDEAIRDRYEFWTFGYPTGAPIPYMAAEYREAIREMLAFRRGRGAATSRITVVGHSMGGLLSKAMTLSSGDKEWNRLFRVPIGELDVSSDDRETLRNMIYFQPIPEIRRVLFCATPHRGSKIVEHPAAKLVGDLIQVPTQLLLLSTEIITKSAHALTPAGLEFARDSRTSIDQLSGEAWTTAEFLNKPLNPAVTYHSLIGIKRGPEVPFEETGDGVIPYTSAHIEGVASELVVKPSQHTVHHTDRGIEEIRRILID